MGAVAELAKSIPKCCLSVKCQRDGCKVKLDGVSKIRLIIDLDCKAYGNKSEARCDFCW